jgi:hypothetical protein
MTATATTPRSAPKRKLILVMTRKGIKDSGGV